MCKFQGIQRNLQCLEIFLKKFDVTIDITSNGHYSNVIRCNINNYIITINRK